MHQECVFVQLSQVSSFVYFRSGLGYVNPYQVKRDKGHFGYGKNNKIKC